MIVNHITRSQVEIRRANQGRTMCHVTQSDLTEAVIQLLITFWIFKYLKLLKNRSIALENLYLKCFGRNSIRWSDGCQISRQSRLTGEFRVEFRPFVTRRFVQSSRSQKKICRAFQELSNGIHRLVMCIKLYEIWIYLKAIAHFIKI